MNPSMEKRAQRIQDAARTSLARRMFEREQKILASLVLEYRSGTITNEKLYGGIAAISELRSIVIEVEQDQMQGADDSLSMFTQGN